MNSVSADVDTLKGMRVLVVEDSFLIAWSLRRILTELGCRVVGPVSTVAQAMRLIEERGCDAAILDVNLGTETSLPIAETLSARSTPFFFVTGYASPALSAHEFQAQRRLRKPLTEATLRNAMLEDFIRER